MNNSATLIDLILGFYIPQEGKIYIDKYELNELDLFSYRSKIGYVPQDNELFNTSIKNNILWANEDATKKEIKKSLEVANALDFTEKLKNGINTIVGDKGAKISGGQRQRIALARAIIKNPEILILDEATSSLDSKSEKLIQDSLDNISKYTTMVIIAHRLSTIKNCNKIIVLNQGNIIEIGDYDYLMNKKESFYNLVKQQNF